MIGSSVLVLLVAASNIKDRKSCKGVDIEILGVKDIYFLDKKDVLTIISEEGIKHPAGRAISEFDLQRLEKVLEKNTWVRDAELLFYNNLLLHVNILEKEPVARIFTRNGYSFYIDSSGEKMPLNNKMNVKLPVFTGFPEERKQSAKEDSILVNHIRNLTMYMLDNKFWLAQVAQVDITADNNFEMTPTVGNHIIEFGDGNNYESKFKRLLIFYKQVLSQTGIDTYNKISVKYDRQVIGTKKGIVTRIDSVQALKNIQKLIEEAKGAIEDSVYGPSDRNQPLNVTADSMIMDLKVDSENGVMKKPLTGNTVVAKKSVLRTKAPIEIKPVKKTEPKKAEIKLTKKSLPVPVDTKPKPKAVMKKQTD